MHTLSWRNLTAPALILLVAAVAAPCAHGAAAVDEPEPKHSLHLPDSMPSLHTSYLTDASTVHKTPTATDHSAEGAWLMGAAHDFREPQVLGAQAIPAGGYAQDNLGARRLGAGIRILTLWESRRSTVALQVGRHGTTILQWTSNLAGGYLSERGLLNQLFDSVPFAP